MFGHTKRVPPQAITFGELAGKSAYEPLPPTPLLDPLSPVAAQIESPATFARANRTSVLRKIDELNYISGAPHEIETFVKVVSFNT